VPASRRLSHHISQGDGIAIIVHVPDASAARAAEEGGAKALALDGPIEGIRDATSLPLLWRGRGAPADADAFAIRAGDDADDGGDAAGLELVVDVRDEDELEQALEQLDPEILLLGIDDRGDAADPVESVLALLPDVPAGKLAIADVAVSTRDEVLQLERAGFDAVLVPNGRVHELVGTSPPDV
jgi:indole-3-glycerol phosphate synthase